MENMKENKENKNFKMNNTEEIVIEGKKVSEKKRSLILFNLVLTNTAAGIMATSLTTALPPIMKDLHIDVNTAQWLTSGFSLFLAVMTPFTAFLIKRFKTKMLYCTALVLFIAGLIVCSVATRFWIMMVGRIIQGSGAGLMNAMAQVIILNIYPPEKIGTAMGWYGFSFGVAPVIAPTLAGVIVDFIGWRMIFVFAAIVMSAALVMALFNMENVLPLMKRSFDTISLIISAISFGGITLAIGNIGKYEFVSNQVLLVLVIGLIASVFFVYRQLHLKYPFLDLRILKDKRFCIATVAVFVLQLTILGNAIILPIYVQQIKHQSATMSGLVILPGSLISAFISPLSGKLYDKFGIRVLYYTGSFLTTLSCILIFFMKYETSIWVMSGFNIFRCIALALFNMPVFTWGTRRIPKSKTSDATALNNSIRSMGGALGSALFVSILTKVSSMVPYKEHPDMFGYNVVYLIMALLGFLIFCIGFLGVKEDKDERVPDKKEFYKKKFDPTSSENDIRTIENDVRTIEMKEMSNSNSKDNNTSKEDIDIIIEKDAKTIEVNDIEYVKRMNKDLDINNEEEKDARTIEMKEMPNEVKNTINNNDDINIVVENENQKSLSNNKKN
jgi:EmrB/QacA subfamily drug resistance transporter